MAFFALGATQLGVALGSRARPGTLANPSLLAAIAAALALQVAGLYVPPLRDLLSTQPLPALDLLIVCATVEPRLRRWRLEPPLHWEKALESAATGAAATSAEAGVPVGPNSAWMRIGVRANS